MLSANQNIYNLPKEILALCGRFKEQSRKIFFHDTTIKAAFCNLALFCAWQVFQEDSYEYEYKFESCPSAKGLNKAQPVEKLYSSIGEKGLIQFGLHNITTRFIYTDPSKMSSNS